jgi:hypothetical protein
MSRHKAGSYTRGHKAGSYTDVSKKRNGASRKSWPRLICRWGDWGRARKRIVSCLED